MIDVFPFAGFPVAVFGLGRSGIATALALQESDAEVWAWDDNEDARAAAEAEGVSLNDLHACDWREMTTLVVSPGVPLDHPEVHPIVANARAANCEVIGDIELLVRTQRWCNYIGITGTNGKSTTTALLGHIMQVAGREAEVGGNLGIPVLTLDPLGAEGTYVLEMSSYQLELTPSVTFDVAVLLNISADHLDRHGGMDGYIAAKRIIFQRQTKPRAAIIGIDDDICRGICDKLKAADEQVVIPVSGRERVHGGVYAIDCVLYDDMDGTEMPVCNLRQNPSLLGTHNGQNAAAAYAAARRTYHRCDISAATPSARAPTCSMPTTGTGNGTTAGAGTTTATTTATTVNGTTTTTCTRPRGAITRPTGRGARPGGTLQGRWAPAAAAATPVTRLPTAVTLLTVATIRGCTAADLTACTVTRWTRTV